MTTFTTEDRINSDTQKKFSDLIIELHDLAREIKNVEISHKVRMIANDLAITGNEYHDYTNQQIRLKL
jgi:hypothetical protein